MLDDSLTMPKLDLDIDASDSFDRGEVAKTEKPNLKSSFAGNKQKQNLKIETKMIKKEESTY